MAVWKRKSVRMMCRALVVLLFILLVLLNSFQLQDVGWDEEIIYTGEEPYWKHEVVDYGGKQVSEDGTDEHDVKHIDAATLDIKYPIILWWTGFTGERGKVKKCGEDQCFFTIDRHFQHHPQTRAFLFYGTDFNPEDAPIPRKPHHEWGLLHEESPKNNYMLSRPECLTLFNHTSTFKRVSDYPITTQYLPSISALTSKQHFVQLAEKNRQRTGLAPVLFVQSDCNPPSDRDSYVRELMKYIPIDSYGACLHNKDLPKRLKNPLTMFEDEFYKIIAQYKFTLAFENALCDDYITEKLWRPLILGSVPVYRGSPSVRDWLPDNRSAIVVDEYSSPEELANYLKYLDQSDEEYEKYVNFKSNGVTNERLSSALESREWGVNDYTRTNFIDGFACHVCNRLHSNMRAKQAGQPETEFIAKPNHYDCPRPCYFKENDKYSEVRMYQGMYDDHSIRAKAFRKLVESGKTFTAREYSDLVMQMFSNRQV